MLKKDSKESISSPRDFPARIYLWRVKEQDLTAIAQGYSLKSCESFAWLDPASSSWKMSQASLAKEWESYSRSFPKQGMMRNGKLYHAQRSAVFTKGRGSGLLPTPTATERSGVNPKTGKGGGLTHSVGGQLNPVWVEWLMGYPEGWTDCEGLEIP